MNKLRHQIIPIRNALDLRELTTKDDRWLKLRKVRIALLAPHMDWQQRAAIEKTINDSLADCGCAMGGAVALGLGLLALVYEVFYFQFSSFAIVRDLVALTFTVFLGGFVGKVVGLYLARKRFRRLSHELFMQLSAPVSP